MRFLNVIIFLFTFYVGLGLIFSFTLGLPTLSENLYNETTSEDYDPYLEYVYGEYHLSDKYDFKNIVFPGYLTEGETITIEGDIDVNMPLDDAIATIAKTELRLRFWDATRGEEPDPYITKVTLQLSLKHIDTPFGKGDDIQFDIEGGTMPSTDMYFVLELLERHRLKDTEVIFEKYGGKIQGEHNLSPGEAPIMRHGGSSDTNMGFINWFTRFIDGYGKGFDAINRIPVFGLFINSILFGVIPIITGYMVYSEVKSWTPLIAGD